jgi:hypothetical protein
MSVQHFYGKVSRVVVVPGGCSHVEKQQLCVTSKINVDDALGLQTHALNESAR